MTRRTYVPVSLLILGTAIVLATMPAAARRSWTPSAPEARDSVVTTQAGMAVTGMLQGDTGGTPVFQLISTGANGVATLLNASTGAFNYQPSSGFTGLDQVTFQVSDGTTWSGTGTVFVFVTWVDPSPDTVALMSLSGDATHAVGGAQSVVSADGRFVAFASNSSELVAGDTNNWSDVFVRDLATGVVTRVSVSSLGQQGDQPSELPALSADGRFVAFMSRATNLVPGDNNAATDVFVHDRVTQLTERVSVSTAGVEGNSFSSNGFNPSISANGRFVAYTSPASNLVPGDANGQSDVFVHDRLTHTTERISVKTDGGEANGQSVIRSPVSLSADGRYVVFESSAGNLFPAGSPITRVYVRDRLAGVTELVALGSNGLALNHSTLTATISADGRVVAFRTGGASSLQPGFRTPFAAIVVRDRLTGQTSYASLRNDGLLPNGNCQAPFASADARYVSFTCFAADMMSGDTNGQPDAFVHDRVLHATMKVSRAPDGSQANAGAAQGGPYENFVSLNADGRVSVFNSSSTNLVAITDTFGIDVFAATVPVPATGTLTGFVTSSGVPIAGVEIVAFNALGVEWGSATTDANGQYTLTVSSGSYYLQTRNPQGHVNQAAGDVLCVPACAPGDGSLVVVTADMVTPLNFGLQPASSLAGTVTDLAAQAVPDTLVAAYDAGGALAGTAATDLTGAYQIDGLPAGTYRVQIIDARGFGRQAFSGAACQGTCAPDVGDLVTTTGGAVTASIDFSLAALGPPDAAYLAYLSTGPGGIAGWSVSVVDTVTAQVVGQIPVPTFVHDVAVSADGDTVFAAGESALFIIDTATNELRQTLPLASHASAILASPDGTRVFVLHSNGVVSVLDATTGGLLASLSATGESMAVSPDGLNVYVVGDLGLSVIDVMGGNVAGPFEVCRSVQPVCFGYWLRDVAVSADGGSIYISAVPDFPEDDQVLVLDRTTLAVKDRMRLRDGVPSAPGIVRFGLATPTEGSLAYVAMYATDPTLTTVSTATNNVRRSLPTILASRLAVTPDGRFAMLRGVAPVGNGNYQPRFDIVDTADDTTRTVNVGTGGSAVTVAPVPQQGIYPRPLTAAYGTPLTLTARLVKNGLPAAGRTVDFSVNGSGVGSAVTDFDGVATLAGITIAGLTAGSYPAGISASFAGDVDVPASARTARLTIVPAIPAIVWPVPAPLASGTPLGATQLNAAAAIAGTFAYSPADGTILPVGRHAVTATFTPADSTNYTTASATTTVSVYYETGGSSPRPESTLNINAYAAHPIGFDPSTGSMYVPRPPNEVAIVNSLTNTVTGSLVLQSGSLSGFAHAVGVDAPARRAYVSSGQHLWVFNLDTHAVVEIIAMPATAVALNTHTGIVYSLRPGAPWQLNILDPALPAGHPSRVTTLPLSGCPDSLAFNPAGQILYSAGRCTGVDVVDVNPVEGTYHTVVGSIPAVAPIAVNRLTGRAYAVTNPEGSPLRQVVVIEADRNKPQFNSIIAQIPITQQPAGYDPTVPLAFTLDAGRNLLYAFVGYWYYWDFSPPGSLTAIDTTSNSIIAVWPLKQREGPIQVLATPASYRIYVFGGYSPTEVLLDPPPSTAAAGAGGGVAPVAVEIGTTSVTFDDVTSSGDVNVETIDPATANLTLPGQFSLAGAAGYEITTTAGFDGPITVCFDMSSVTDPDAFSALRVLHGENGAWVDRTVSSDFATGQICASVTSLSPFAIAVLSASYDVELLFDHTRAFKAGSTIPLKIRLLTAGANVSSPLVSVSAKRLTRISTGTTAATQDAGQANPDGDFRYSAQLGGYVFNLSTKGLASGTYELTFRAAGETVLHTLQFQVK